MVTLPNPYPKMYDMSPDRSLSYSDFCCQLMEIGDFPPYADEDDAENMVLWAVQAMLQESKVGYVVLHRQHQAHFIDMFLSAGVISGAVEFTGPTTGSPLILLLLDPSFWRYG